MLGLGSSITKGGAGAKTIVTDSLVLKHGYARGPVQPVSTGAAHLLMSAGNFIDLGDLTDFDFSGDFTLALWIRAEGASSYNAIMSNYETDKGWWFILNGGKLRMGLENQIDTSTQGLDLRDGKWHHVAVTCTTSNIILYTDGVLIYEKTGSTWTPAQTSSATTMIGKRTGIDEFDGYMCNVGAWSAVLTQPQIKSIMYKDYAGLSDSEKTSLVSWWNLDSTLTDTTVLDNHYGGGSELGSELVDNGTFDSDLTSWTTSATDSDNTIVQADGKVVLTADGSTALLLQQTGIFVVGQTYKVQFDAYDITGAGFKIQSGDNENISAITAAGSYTVYHTATGTSVNIYRRTNSAASAGKLDNISVKLVNGNTGTLS